MAITDPLVLPADVLIVPVEQLPATVRDQLAPEAGEFAVTRPRARTPSRIIDADAAALLEEFRSPRTIVEAVIRYSQGRQADPEATLEAAFPMLQGFVQSQVLVPADAAQAGAIEATLEVGGRVADFEVLRRIQVLEDTELYQVRDPAGREAALKLARPGAEAALRRVYGREAAILKELDGAACPRLLAEGELEGRPYLAIEWCPGVDAASASQQCRHRGGPEARRALLGLGRAILAAYARLHERGVVHGDVHPRNVLVADDGSVRLIDFGLARREGHPGPEGRPHRGGVGFFFEPEFARARRGGHRPPPASQAGEQYALGALLYLLLSGVHYLDFSVEKGEMYRQIADDAPTPFARRGLRPWPEVEPLLARALSKEPADRFPSVAAFAAALDAVVPDPPAAPAHVGPAVAAGRAAAPAEELLDGVLRRLGRDGPLLAAGLGSAPLCSVNNGAAGIAYALYRIACVREDAGLLSLADLWAARAARDLGSDRAFFSRELEITPEVVGPVSPYHTASGVSVVQALIAQAMGDVVSLQNGLDGFLAASAAPCENLDLTLGRSGTLLACALLREAVPEDTLVNVQPLRDFGHEVLRGLRDELDAQAPIRDVPRMAFLGIAHGWAGALYATLRWCRCSGQEPPGSVAERLQQLRELAEPEGRGVRWKRKLRKRGPAQPHDYVPSWCNGTAGFVHLWTLAHAATGEPAFLELAERAAWDAHDDPTVLGDLCCGLSGRAYALLNLWKATGEAAWLPRARELADRAARAVATTTVREDSLYKGAVGVAVLAAELARPEGSCMPLFEDEGWPAR